MDTLWLRATFQYFRQINFSRRIKAHNNNLELLSPNKKWFYADAIIIQDFQVCGYWIDDHYRIWRLIVTNHFKSHLFANKGDTFYNNKLEYIIHSYDHTHTHWRHGLEKYERFFLPGLHQNVFLGTLEIHFTFDIWSKNLSITMKRWPKDTKVDPKNPKNHQFMY